MEELNTKVCILQSHLYDLVDCVRENERKKKQFEAFESHLLTLNSLHELVECLLDDTKKVFGLDAVTFTLVDEKQELVQFLTEDGLYLPNEPCLLLIENVEPLNHLFGKAIRPFLGKYRDEDCSDFFPEMAQKPASVAIMPLFRRGNYLGSLNLGSMESGRFSAEMATDYLERLSFVVSLCLENTLNFEFLRRTSFIDALTGVNNRRFFDQRIGEEIDRAQRTSEPLSCLFLDIDYFKGINDTYGHQMGDQVLAEIAEVIRSQLRSNDVLARYGGEEFIALLSNASEKKALEVAERIRKKVAARTLESKNERTIIVNISIGVATFTPGSKGQGLKINARELVSMADQALYEAKNNGRNCVVSGGILPVSSAMENVRQA